MGVDKAPSKRYIEYPETTNKMLNPMVTEKEKFLLIKLMEEAAEVQQMASKIMRFGWLSRHPESAETNWDGLRREYLDLEDAMYKLRAAYQGDGE